MGYLQTPSGLGLQDNSRALRKNSHDTWRTFKLHKYRAKGGIEPLTRSEREAWPPELPCDAWKEQRPARAFQKPLLLRDINDARSQLVIQLFLGRNFYGGITQHGTEMPLLLNTDLMN